MAVVGGPVKRSEHPEAQLVVITLGPSYVLGEDEEHESCSIAINRCGVEIHSLCERPRDALLSHGPPENGVRERLEPIGSVAACRIAANFCLILTGYGTRVEVECDVKGAPPRLPTLDPVSGA
jgi:hypothetical protein